MPLRRAPLNRHPGYKTGSWYNSFQDQATLAAGASAFVSGSIYCSPLWIERPTTIHALGARVTTQDAAPGHIQLAIYFNDPTTINRPGLKINSTADISVASTGSVSGVLGSDCVLSPGWYWRCLQSDSTTVRMASYTGTTNQGAAGIIGSTTLNNLTAATGFIQGISTTGSYGTWPADLTSGPPTWTEIVSSVVPYVVWQVA